MADLSGKAAIVTGAPRNLGRRIAVSLGERGADIVIHHHDHRSSNDVISLRNEIEASGARAVIVAGDLSHPANAQSLVDKAVEAFGRLDVLVNCAGKIVKKPMAQVTDEEFDSCLGINTKAPFYLMRAAAKVIQDNGRIINIGTGILGATTGFYSAYVGTKAPMEHFARALAHELGSRGVTVNTVAPGPLDDDFFHSQETDESTAFLARSSVQNRLGTFEDVLPLIEFVTSARSGWVTAQTLFVNGGQAAR